jgi:hypothetical protein
MHFALGDACPNARLRAEIRTIETKMTGFEWIGESTVMTSSCGAEF